MNVKVSSSLYVCSQKSDQSKDPSDRPVGEAGRGTPGAEEGAEERDDDDEEKLAPREERWHSLAQDEIELEQHRVADRDTNEHTQYARAEHHDEGLVEVEHAHAILGEAHGSQHAHFFLLLVQVGRHARAKGEEAQEHRHGDQAVEHLVEDRLYFGRIVAPAAGRRASIVLLQARILPRHYVC